LLIREYAAFVEQTDQFSKNHSDGVQGAANPREIVIFGLASELGSVISAIKKEWLNEGGALTSPLAKAELIEELGDAMWYAFSLARISNTNSTADILIADIDHLASEIADKSERSQRIREVLSEKEVDSFLLSAKAFSINRERTLSDYQKLAYKTARTERHVLLKVCAAVLTQASGQLMRHLLPAIEKELNQQSQDQDISVLLGWIAWHLCAIASLYDINIDEVAEYNKEKASARQNDGVATPLHDSEAPEGQKFPKEFKVDFKSVDEHTVEIYWKGERKGDPLKDQYSIEDGYRYHDVIHLANAAVLGWSPVLRDLFKIKRTSCKKTKQEEDGGRSAVVEELVIKFIHWEAARRAKELHVETNPYDRPLFLAGEEIPFSLVKKVRELTFGHEVYANKYWEWEKAIREGYRVFHLLKQHRGGTVIVDLNQRCLRFEPPTAFT
jgi:NTP pyrophosphatase (non-canonical NTP hydrolase)